MTDDVRDGEHPRTWRSSSRCNQLGNCVEVGRVRHGVVIRDSKSAVELPAIGTEQWARFLQLCHVVG